MVLSLVLGEMPATNPSNHEAFNRMVISSHRSLPHANALSHNSVATSKATRFQVDTVEAFIHLHCVLSRSQKEKWKAGRCSSSGSLASIPSTASRHWWNPYKPVNIRNSSLKNQGSKVQGITASTSKPLEGCSFSSMTAVSPHCPQIICHWSLEFQRSNGYRLDSSGAPYPTWFMDNDQFKPPIFTFLRNTVGTPSPLPFRLVHYLLLQLHVKGSRILVVVGFFNKVLGDH